MLEHLLIKLDIERGDWELQAPPPSQRCGLFALHWPVQVQTTFPNLMPAS